MNLPEQTIDVNTNLKSIFRDVDCVILIESLRLDFRSDFPKLPCGSMTLHRHEILAVFPKWERKLTKMLKRLQTSGIIRIEPLFYYANKKPCSLKKYYFSYARCRQLKSIDLPAGRRTFERSWELAQQILGEKNV